MEDDSDKNKKSSWKLVKSQYLKDQHQDAPKLVKPAARLKDDLEALNKLFTSKSPPLRLVRGKQIAEVIYGFTDASGHGMGSSWSKKGALYFRIGV